MTTDNRTNEPTPEQVEAAAIAFTCETHDEWERSPEPYKEMIREDMRAALVAAQGAAPQAERDCLCYGADGVTEPKCPACVAVDCDRDRMGICKRCGMGWDARKVLDGDFACPVLSSSGVDEDALAEVIWQEQSDRVRDGYVIHTRETALSTARAVAEWLEGQGR